MIGIACGVCGKSFWPVRELFISRKCSECGTYVEAIHGVPPLFHQSSPLSGAKNIDNKFHILMNNGTAFCGRPLDKPIEFESKHVADFEKCGICKWAANAAQESSRLFPCSCVACQSVKNP